MSELETLCQQAQDLLDRLKEWKPVFYGFYPPATSNEGRDL